MTITKAIIPVAGWGTRRLPITKAIEKCMLPIGNRPLVDYVVADCIAAGITDIYLVVSGSGTQLRQYYSDNTELNKYLVRAGKEGMLEAAAPPAGTTFHFIEQIKNGTAAAVASAAPYIKKNESVVVLMGDDFIYNADGSSEVRRLLEGTADGGCSMLGVTIPRDQVGRYGVIETTDDNRFVRIVEKPTPEEAPSTLINISKYVINHDALQLIVDSIAVAKPGEYYITDPINQYVSDGGELQVIKARGQYLDGGSVEGWLYANRVVLGDL